MTEWYKFQEMLEKYLPSDPVGREILSEVKEDFTKRVRRPEIPVDVLDEDGQPMFDDNNE